MLKPSLPSELAHRLFGEVAFARVLHVEVVVGLRGHAHLDPAEHDEHRERQHHRDHHGQIEPDARENADGGGDPDRRGGSEAAHVEAFLDDDAGAQEADAGHDALGHARRIEARLARGAHPVVFVHGDQHEQARGQAHQHVGAQARGPPVERALVADEGARRERRQQPHQHLDVVGPHVHHGRNRPSMKRAASM